MLKLALLRRYRVHLVQVRNDQAGNRGPLHMLCLQQEKDNKILQSYRTSSASHQTIKNSADTIHCGPYLDRSIQTLC